MYELAPLNYTITNRALGVLLDVHRASPQAGVAEVIGAGVNDAASLADCLAREMCLNLANLAAPLRKAAIDESAGHGDLNPRVCPFASFLNELPPADFEFKKRTLLKALDIYNPNTRIHSIGVAAYASVIGRNYGLLQTDLDLLELAGSCHDIGKLAVPLSITKKQGPLDPGEETEIMRMHQIIGYFILRKLKGFGEAAEVMRHCHFHKGYPAQFYPMGGPCELSTLQHILIMADIIEACRSSKRAYRDEPLPWNDIITILRENHRPAHPEELIGVVERVLARPEFVILTDPGEIH